MSRSASSPSTGRWAIVGLVLFLLFDALLVGWALSAHRGNGSVVAAPVPVPAVTTPAPDETPTMAPASTPVRLLSVLDDRTAWRSVLGACQGTPPSLELTTDAGRTWQPSDIAGIAGVGRIASVQATSVDIASVVAFDARNCAPVLALSYVAGGDWVTYPDRVTGSWFVDPATPSLVHTPTGDVQAPCSAMTALASGGGANAAVLCADHTVHRTEDTGATWSAPIPVPGSVAIGDSGSGYLVATAGLAECAGVAVTTVPDAATAPSGPGVCATDSAPAAGEVAVDAAGGTAWLWAGDELATSADGGATWR